MLPRMNCLCFDLKTNLELTQWLPTTSGQPEVNTGEIAFNLPYMTNFPFLMDHIHPM